MMKICNSTQIAQIEGVQKGVLLSLLQSAANEELSDCWEFLSNMLESLPYYTL